jgi:predicted PurR-regulated permease PerM
MNSSLQSMTPAQLWLISTLFGVICVILGVIYKNMRDKINSVSQTLDNYRVCTDNRIEDLLLQLTVVKEKVISKQELTEAINEAVKSQFLGWENRLFHEGRLVPQNNRKEVT